MLRNEVKRIWPELEWIEDKDLRERTTNCWVRAFELSPLEPADLERAAAPETRAAIVRALSALGYRHVTLDLDGYGTRADPID